MVLSIISYYGEAILSLNEISPNIPWTGYYKNMELQNIVKCV
jgi:hypothetical protein